MSNGGTLCRAIVEFVRGRWEGREGEDIYFIRYTIFDRPRPSLPRGVALSMEDGYFSLSFSIGMNHRLGSRIFISFL